MSVLKRHPKSWSNYHRSPEETLLAQHITEALIELSMTQAQRHQISSSLTREIVEVLDMYLTIAGNSLAESQRFLGSGKLTQAQGRLELAENELRSSRRIIQTHETDAETMMPQQLSKSMIIDDSVHNHKGDHDGNA
jgi:hypothetical protein